MKIYIKNNRIIIDFEGASLISNKKIDNAVYINDNVDIINLDAIIGSFSTGISIDADTKRPINLPIIVNEIVLSENVNYTIHYLIRKYIKKSFLRWLILKIIKIKN